ncbi:MraY family glycosyltransferase [Hydromonas duriensis]|uniref:UDP-N-acetylmuramyl pentapeptide phosphotransferase/UDP-N-acetylglucosamine-1-phosphate transferase n=1 Tax=Hydromonas duriensis TaxID=1527608 RepID=A0A4R6Y551_9BURK|nr:glycosyltransferase [Hydromonas duriensis]TDR30386.1 UDP-N-acetylmuramyl pentapeptide phosphotransferase/UDP-N-acetylglucosamine-1-phosphate transferase [Hydromonas duriensis]
MIYFFTSLFFSFLTTLLLVRYHHIHSHISHDHELDGPQKFHNEPVPRIGGIGIFVGLVTFLIFSAYRKHPSVQDILFLTLSSGFAFGAGLLEDFIKCVPPFKRLLFTALSAIVAFYLVSGATVNRLDLGWLDILFTISIFSCLFTAVSVAGIANSINIIDGFNGLSSVVVCTMLLSIAYVAFVVGDTFVLSTSLALIGAILGFFIWNYPSGYIFLGDGGAYLIGFFVAELAVILVGRHATVSAWYPALLFMYPMIETLFSMYRRWLKRKPASEPDGVHLHSLLYRRMIRWVVGYQHISIERRNAMTSPYLWLLSSMAVAPATIFFESTFILISFCILFAVSYIWIYRRIIRFNSPSWLNWLYLSHHDDAEK